MGTCVSKCYPCTPCEQNREKIGFASAAPKIVPNTSSSSSSSSYASPKIVPRSVPNTHHLSPPSSSYTYTCTSSSTSTSSSSSMASSSSSCSSSATNSTCKPFSNEFLLSCARNNPNLNLEFPPSCADDGNYSIVVLDPKKRTWEATTTKFPVPPPPPPPPPQRRTVAIRGPPSQNPSFPAKRVRSSSPTPRTGRKSFRADPPPPPSTAPGGRGRARKEKTIEQQAHQSRSLSANSEKERFSNRIHRIAPPPPPRGSEVRGVEALLPKKESFRASPLLEDLNNPLISMDCFIFL